MLLCSAICFLTSWVLRKGLVEVFVKSYCRHLILTVRHSTVFLSCKLKVVAKMALAKRICELAKAMENGKILELVAAIQRDDVVMTLTKADFENENETKIMKDLASKGAVAGEPKLTLMTDHVNASTLQTENAWGEQKAGTNSKRRVKEECKNPSLAVDTTGQGSAASKETGEHSPAPADTGESRSAMVFKTNKRGDNCLTNMAVKTSPRPKTVLELNGNNTPQSAANNKEVCTSTTTVDGKEVCTSTTTVDGTEVCTSTTTVDGKEVCTSTTTVDGKEVCTSTTTVDGKEVCTSTTTVDGTEVCTSTTAVDGTEVCTTTSTTAAETGEIVHSRMNRLQVSRQNKRLV